MANKKRKAILSEITSEDCSYSSLPKRIRKKWRGCDTETYHYSERDESSTFNSVWRIENLASETGTSTPTATTFNDLSVKYKTKKFSGNKEGYGDCSTHLSKCDRVLKSTMKMPSKINLSNVQILKNRTCKEGKECGIIPGTSGIRCNGVIKQRDVDLCSPLILDYSNGDDCESRLDESPESLTDFDRFVQENGGHAEEVPCFASRFDNVDDCPLCESEAGEERRRSYGTSSQQTTYSCDMKDNVCDRMYYRNGVNIASGFVKNSQLKLSFGKCAQSKLTIRHGKDQRRKGDGFEFPKKLQHGVDRKWGSSGEEDESSGSTCSDDSIRLMSNNCGLIGLEEEVLATHNTFNGQNIPSISIPDWMYVAIDCEMVGVGPKGRGNALARCSVVDYSGKILYDRFVRPDANITDYRTRWSGVRPEHMRYAEPMAKAVVDVHKLLENKIIVGHSVYNDFRVLKFNPPFYIVRDTAQSRHLVKLAGLEGRGNGLKKLSAALLNRSIQTQSTGHCSVEDARASLDLFKMVRHQFETELYAKWTRKDKTMSQLARYVVDANTAREEHPSYGTEFLQDEYWPSDVIE